LRLATRYNAGVMDIGHRRPGMWALAAVVAVLGWQALTVHANYGGNWSGLFRVGGAMRVPERLAASTFRNRHPIGYDGQFYRLLAHDPFLRQGTAAYFDGALWRSRRILVPLTAWVLACGWQGAIDGAYVLVVAGFVWLGTYWLGLIVVREGRHAALGLLFLAVPATLVAIDSMTVDVALAALAAGYVCQLSTGRERGLWLILAAAALVRETGLALAVACVATALIKRDFRKSLFRATAVLPALAWYGYLHAVLPAGQIAVPHWIPRLELGVLVRALDPPHYPLLGAPLERIVRLLDSLALAATMAAAAIGIVRFRVWPREVGIALGLYAALLLSMTNPIFWTDPYGYSRSFAPIFVLVLAGSARLGGRSLAVAGVVCGVADLRVLAEMETQVVGVARWLGVG
jgi:hypothetical protein